MSWHLDPQWQHYVTQVFLMVGRVRSWRTVYTDRHGIAGVLPEKKLLVINPALLPIPKQPDFPLRFAGTQTELLRAIVAHEAAHVAFSAPKPLDDTGWLWNALEDERIEREATRRYPELLTDFSFLGDVMLHNSPTRQAGRAWDLKNACLMWRFAHDRPELPFPVTDDTLWARIRPLVEEAWDAEPGAVASLARALWEMLPEKDRQAQPEHSLSAGGAGTQEKGAQGEPETEGADKNSDPDDQSGQDTPDQNRTSQDQPSQGTEHGPDTLPSPPDSLPEKRGERGGLVQQAPDPASEHHRALVKEVGELLAPRERPGQRVRSRSCGRYDFQRHQQGQDKYFRRRGRPTRPTPFFMRVILDLSASMGGTKLQSAKALCSLLIEAAQEARSHAEIWGFNAEAFLISDESAPEALHKIASASVGYTTRLGAALEEVFEHSPRMSRTQEIVLIICDGELTSSDRDRCARLMQAQAESPRLIVPLLIEGGYAGQDTWAYLFGQSFAVSSATLSTFLRDYLSELRAQGTWG